MEGNTGTATISIESFSYRWLVNLKSTLESLDDDHLTSSDIEAAAFIVMDPKNTPSKRFLVDDFNFPTTPSSIHNNTHNNFSLVHAEELFSNGTFLIPAGTTLFSTKKIEKSIDNGINSSPVNSKPLKNNIVISIHQIHSIFAKKCWKSSKKMFRKCLIGLFSNHNDKTTVYSSSSSPSSSPKSLVSSRSLLVDRRRRNSQNLNRSMSSPSSLTTNTTTIAPEGSIYEAVLHCKKSIEK
ncbi:hypothetical protein MKW98_021022 [Papaver atlanticum]|uniref:Membrane-associated kinase regulator 6 n=1 Tax=Papaver atlanticum TaxID=357466 RepID=A0AAD4XTX1_9MAGN|nr:hypothetical protein MKW98_021022 [Papaver atlanticum]